MRRLALFIFASCVWASASTVYVSQSGGSVSCGADGSESTTALASVTWTSGNTYKLCGTITSSVTVGANNLTVYFESGASITEGICPSTGCLNTNSHAGLTIDGGGGNCGFVGGVNVTCSQGAIIATASGSAYGNGSTSSFGIEATGCAGCEIKGLLISDIYQHTSSTDAPSGDFRCIDQLGITTTGSSYLVHNMTMHDCSSALVYVPGSSSDNGPTYYYNETYNVNSCNDLSNNDNGTFVGGVIHDTHCHDTSNWDTTSPSCAQHHNFMHQFSYTQTAIGVLVYNNLIDGNWGNCMTSELFFEGSSSLIENIAIFNNRFLATYSQANNGIVSASALGGGYLYFLNNTILGDSGSGDNCESPNATGSAIVYSENNIVSGCNGELLFTDGAASIFNTVDYNVYGGTSSSTPWGVNCSSGCSPYYTWSTWQGAGYDTHGLFNSSTSYVAVNSNGTLQSTSPARGAGANLTSLCSTFSQLCTDAAGHSRPASGAWDNGALSYANSTTAIFSGGTLKGGTMQ